MKRSVQYASLAAFIFAAASLWADDVASSSRTTSWTWPSYIIFPLIAIALLYAVGLMRMRHRNSRLRFFPVAFFVGGWLSILVALDSPIHEISEQLFWVHMTQHEILMLISAPLLVLSEPAAVFLWSLPESWRGPVASISKLRLVKHGWLAVSAPLSAWLLHAIALWAWHAPRLFVPALESDLVHAAQHISFLGSALLFWWALFHNHAGLGYGGAILYVFTTAIHTSVLGAWLTFSPQVWYAYYASTAPQWHLTAIQDQQLGGLIMWIPAGTLLTIAALVLLGKWIRHSEDRWQYTHAAAVIRASVGVAK